MKSPDFGTANPLHGLTEGHHGILDARYDAWSSGAGQLLWASFCWLGASLRMDICWPSFMIHDDSQCPILLIYTNITVVVIDMINMMNND